MPNLLIHETSPYLLQHANNPVNWHAWNSETLHKAKTENKALLISIGYSTCHWCHVMEHECFEDEEVAEVMNQFFICIKIDREERPELDAFYMDSLHVLGIQGGWPLNVFALPTGEPIWGGTYFPKPKWIGILERIHELFAKEQDKIMAQAQEISATIQTMYTYDLQVPDSLMSKQNLLEGIQTWKTQFDLEYGGQLKEYNKFPLPTNYSFLLDYLSFENDEAIRSFVDLSLKKISYGGIFDHLEGGFCRYSTDRYWKVPHFEKMLYDNAQLISVYCKALREPQGPSRASDTVYPEVLEGWYKEIVQKTIAFCIAQLYDENTGSFYSALDADTEGVEGKYYVWTEDELKAVLTSQEFALAKEYYTLTPGEIWEHNNYVLYRTKEWEEIIACLGLPMTDANTLLASIQKKLIDHKLKTRAYPGLDHKVITSWNALMIKALCDAYSVFKEDSYKQTAEKTLSFLMQNMLSPENDVYHIYTQGKIQKNAFLEDAAFLLEALISFYEISGNEPILLQARAICEQAIDQFYDSKTGFFFLSNDTSEIKIKKLEVYDQVIPSSNSTMANNLFLLSKYFRDEKYASMAYRMLNTVNGKFSEHLSGYTKWAELFLKYHYPFYELMVVGENASSTNIKNQVSQNVLLAYKNSPSKLPILEEEHVITNETQYYLCDHEKCYPPTNNMEEIIQKIK